MVKEIYIYVCIQSECSLSPKLADQQLQLRLDVLKGFGAKHES